MSDIRIIGSSGNEFSSDPKKFYEKYWKEGETLSAETMTRYGRIIAHLFPEGVSGKRILEIGVGGEGGIIYHLKGQNEVYGIDASLSAKTNCEKLGLRIELADVDRDGIRFADGFFDAVFAFEIAEHFSNPQFVIEEIKRTLKDDGILAMSTPNPLIHHWPRLFYPSLFERDAFGEFLMINGFRVDRVSDVGENIYKNRLELPEQKAWSWLWLGRKAASSADFMEIGKYFWMKKDGSGIRNRPMEAIDMFRKSLQLDANNDLARFCLTRGLLYRSFYGEVEEFFRLFGEIFEKASGAGNLRATCHLLLVLLEYSSLKELCGGTNFLQFRPDLLPYLVQRHNSFPGSNEYLDQLQKEGFDVDPEKFKAIFSPGR